MESRRRRREEEYNKDELHFLRLRTAANQRKKEELEEGLEEREAEVLSLRRGIFEAAEIEAAKIAENEALRSLLASLRLKYGEYNKRKAELRAIQTEINTLASTKFTLEQGVLESVQQLVSAIYFLLLPLAHALRNSGSNL